MSHRPIKNVSLIEVTGYAVAEKRCRLLTMNGSIGNGKHVQITVSDGKNDDIAEMKNTHEPKKSARLYGWNRAENTLKLKKQMQRTW